MLLFILLDLPPAPGMAEVLGFHDVTFSGFSPYSSDSSLLVSAADSSSSVFSLNGSLPQGSPEGSHLLPLLNAPYPGDFTYSRFSYPRAGEHQACTFRLEHSTELSCYPLSPWLGPRNCSKQKPRNERSHFSLIHSPDIIWMMKNLISTS